MTPTVTSVSGGGSLGDVVRFVGFSGAPDPATDIDVVIGPRGGSSMRCSVAADLQQPGYQWESAWNCSAGDSTAGLYNM